MNVMGIGPLEIIVILVVALVIVGPERLPRLAADIARTIRELRKYTTSITAEFTEVIQDFEKETESERSQWKDIGEGLTSATRSVTDALRAARSDADAPVTPASAPSGTAAATALPEPAPPSTSSGTWKDIPEPGLRGEPSANGAGATPVDEPR